MNCVLIEFNIRTFGILFFWARTLIDNSACIVFHNRDFTVVVELNSCLRTLFEFIESNTIFLCPNNIFKYLKAYSERKLIE